MQNYRNSAFSTDSVIHTRKPPMRRYFLDLFAAVLVLCLAPCSNSLGELANSKVQRTTVVESPDGNLRLTITPPSEGMQQARYQIAYRGNTVIQQSGITFTKTNGKTIGSDLQVVQAIEEPSEHRGSWRPKYGERSLVRDNYNEIHLNCLDRQAQCEVRFTFRCYDAGVAFQTRIAPVEEGRKIRLAEEFSEFRFEGNPTAWRTTNAQGLYKKVTLRELGKGVERPLVLKLNTGTYVAIAEAKLVDYAKINLQRSPSDPHAIISQLAGQVVASSHVTTPWRVIMVGDSPGQLLENNDIILNLSDPCAIADTSWIKPGKVLREITLTNAGGKACIDFAVKNDFQFVEFDAGWYGHEYDDSSDATTLTLDPQRSKGPFDLLELIEYGKVRGIGVIVYVNRRALEKQLDEILPLYKSWGIEGVKYGFVKTGSQEWTKWLHDAIRKAADHQLMVDVHDEYRPTGYSRTYPNFMTQEGVRGDEATPSAEQTLTTLFTRCLAGATDFTICYFAERVDGHWSHAHQLAKAVCFYDPWQFIYWYDTPLQRGTDKKSILDVPELEFFKHVPVTWDDTKVLHGKIGEYGVIARRSGDQWYIGALNSSEPRSLDTPLDFLDEGVAYTAEIYSDDPSVDTPTQVAIEHREVDASTVFSINMLINGGQAIRLTPKAE